MDHVRRVVGDADLQGLDDARVIEAGLNHAFEAQGRERRQVTGHLDGDHAVQHLVLRPEDLAETPGADLLQDAVVEDTIPR